MSRGQLSENKSIYAQGYFDLGQENINLFEQPRIGELRFILD